jgi:PhnB protein
MIMPKTIPDGFHTLTAHLVVPDGAQAIEFYKNAFGAQEQERHMSPDGKMVMHARLKLGSSLFMLAGEYPPRCLSPRSRGGSSVFLHLYTEDADAAFDRAVKAGCTVRMPVTDMFWGDRYGQVEDPFGHPWAIATHKQDLTPQQVDDNARAFFAKECPDGH